VTTAPSARVVLLGAGHAHLYCIRRAGAFARRRAELVVVEPEPAFWYSGLATGTFGGRFPPGSNRVDLAPLVARGGARLIHDRALAVDPVAKQVRLAHGPPMPYDLLSIDAGSVVPTADVPGMAEFATPAKPLAGLDGLRRDLESRLAAAIPDQPWRLLVVGAGASACELAGNAAALARRSGRPDHLAITLVAGAAVLLPGWPFLASRAANAALVAAGVRIIRHTRIAAVEPGVAITTGGRRLPFDSLLAAHGLVPGPLASACSRPTDDRGALLVDSTLRSIADPTIFSGGDGATLHGQSLPPVGVYAVRQGPILLHNLLASLDRRPLRAYRPRRRVLLILNLGDDTGLARWGPYSIRSRWALWVKDAIDRAFLARYRGAAD